MKRQLLLAVVFAIACTQSNPETTPDAGAPVDGGILDAGPLPGLEPAEGITKYCHDTHQAICEGFASCSCPLDFRGEVESCTAQRAAECEAQLNKLIPLMQQGLTKVTAEGIAACVAGLKAIGEQCFLIKDDTMPLACAGFFMDTASIGEPCRGPTEFHLCADGAGGCDSSTDLHTCIALPEEGQDCAGGEACAAGLRCVNHRTCIREGSSGATCDSPLACEFGLTCGRDGKCVEPYGEGQPCDEPWQCGESFKCDEGVCQPLPELGSACDREGTCGPMRACVGSTKYRKCAPKAAENEGCRSSDDCAAGLACADDSQKCVPLPAKDAECLNRQLCAAGFACDENEQKCVTPPGQGDPCLIGNALCADGLACDANNICQPPPSHDGDPCAEPGNVCGAGLACDFTANGSICHTRRDVGGDCQNDVICKDGLRCDFDTLKCAEPFALDAPCRLGNECGPGRECSRIGGRGYRCREIPSAASAACEFACGGDLACQGAGGECAKLICETQ